MCSSDLLCDPAGNLYSTGTGQYAPTRRERPADPGWVSFDNASRRGNELHVPHTWLYYNTFRYYDADAGRFTAEDPIELEGGLNLYQYAPNPLVWVDPAGLDWTHDTEYEGSLYPGKTAYFGGGWTASKHIGILGYARKGGAVRGTDGKECRYTTECMRIGLGSYAGAGGEIIGASGGCDTKALLEGTTVGFGFDGLGPRGLGPYSGSIFAGSNGVGLSGGRWGRGLGVSIGFDICSTEVSCD